MVQNFHDTQMECSHILLVISRRNPNLGHFKFRWLQASKKILVVSPHLLAMPPMFMDNMHICIYIYIGIKLMIVILLHLLSNEISSNRWVQTSRIGWPFKHRGLNLQTWFNHLSDVSYDLLVKPC